MNRDEMSSNEKTTLLSANEARCRVVDADGKPRWSKAQWNRIVKSTSGPKILRVGNRIFIAAAVLSMWLGGSGIV